MFSRINKNEFWQVIFDELPTNVNMLSSLPQASLKEPHYAAALLIASLCLWGTDQNAAIEMINFIKGPQGLSTYEKQFINERLRGKSYLPYSYFQGSSPENGYKASSPYIVTISTVPTSFGEAGLAMPNFT